MARLRDAGSAETWAPYEKMIQQADATARAVTQSGLQRQEEEEYAQPQIEEEEEELTDLELEDEEEFEELEDDEEDEDEDEDEDEEDEDEDDEDEDDAIELPTMIEPKAQRSPWAWAAPPAWNRDEDDEGRSSDGT